jgi:hypothetical protein
VRLGEVGRAEESLDAVRLEVLVEQAAAQYITPVLAADGATALRLATDSIAAVVLDVGCPTRTAGTSARRCAPTVSPPPSSS